MPSMSHATGAPRQTGYGEHVLFVSHGVPVYRCTKCGLTRLYPQPTRAEVLAFYANSTGHDPFADDAHLPDSVWSTTSTITTR